MSGGADRCSLQGGLPANGSEAGVVFGVVAGKRAKPVELRSHFIACFDRHAVCRRDFHAPENAGSGKMEINHDDFDL
jgi:hypothetical protein